MPRRRAMRGFIHGNDSERAAIHAKEKPKKFFTGKEPAYQCRDAILKKMGFCNYRAYLRSDLWKAIRARLFELFSGCFCCGKPASQIHHAYYCPRNLSGATLDGVFTLCAECHEKIEFNEHGRKVRLGFANRWMFKFRKDNGLQGHKETKPGIAREKGLDGEP